METSLAVETLEMDTGCAHDCHTSEWASEVFSICCVAVDTNNIILVSSFACCRQVVTISWWFAKHTTSQLHLGSWKNLAEADGLDEAQKEHG